MLRQNRVTPFSTLIATPERGTWMGNRGCLHDARGQIRRPFLGKRWIICLLEFRGRKRTVMTPGHYTELFFLDEATALAAGHRPCAECQRERFNLFRETWARANPELTDAVRPTATRLDDRLHTDRRMPPKARTLYDTLDGLADGVFVTDGEQNAYLVLNGQLLRWAPAGYENPALSDVRYPLRLLTPLSIARTLSLGYPAGLHPSALQTSAKRPE